MDIQEFATLGGKASAKKRFKGLTTKQISEQMRKVRLGKEKKYDKNTTKQYIRKNISDSRND